ncbi:MAG: hypothetical protein ACI9ZV_000381 [Candidatus Azotimanducaceae bacterium]|jgi:hypothetical protein
MKNWTGAFSFFAPTDDMIDRSRKFDALLTWHALTVNKGRVVGNLEIHDSTFGGVIAFIVTHIQRCGSVVKLVSDFLQVVGLWPKRQPPHLKERGYT